VAQLKNLVAKQASFDGSTVVENSPATQHHDEQGKLSSQLPADDLDPYMEKDDSSLYRDREFKARYVGPHSVSMAFQQVSLESLMIRVLIY
jgi:hypothetical protein